MVCMELFSGFCSVPTLSTYSVYGADLILVCSARIGKALTEESRCIDREGQKTRTISSQLSGNSLNAC